MIIAVIGLGAVGSIITVDLVRSGFSPYVVCKYENVVNVVKKDGIRVSGVNGEFQVIENIFPVVSEDELPDNIDIAIFSTRAWDVKPALLKILPKLKADSIIIPMVNGVIEDHLIEIIEPRRIISCVVGYAANIIATAHANITKSGQVVFGSFGSFGYSEQFSRQVDIIKEIIQKLSVGGQGLWSENIIGFKYSKLLVNSSITSLGLISDLTIRQLMKRKKTRLTLLTIVTEGVAVAQSANIKLEKLNSLDPSSFALQKSELKRFSFTHWKKHVMLKLIGLKYRKYRSAALEALKRGKQTEIDYLNGYIASKGKKLDVNTPINSMITDLIHDIENRKKNSSINTLELLENQVVKTWDALENNKLKEK